MKKILFGFVFLFGIMMLPLTTMAQPIVNVQNARAVIPKNGVNVPLLRIDVSAQENSLQIKEVHIRQTGMSSFRDVHSLRAYVDDIRSRRAPMLSDYVARIRFEEDVIIPAQSTKQILITGNFRFEEGNRTIRFQLENIVSETAEIQTPQQPINDNENWRDRRMTNHQTRMQSRNPWYRRAASYRGTRSARSGQNQSRWY